ncbi:MAG TPA: class I SAM-dependent methyltransferase [Syntrophales bacterium]|nr:class I SAM-dependent methyltransferase [Syntrophales bacterium]HPQ43544.1 class I SAM-dependent methyltransferase [Syntrophales bacterium]
MLTADFQILDIHPGDRVLDVGCGTGRHACEIFRTLGADVVGVDLNTEDLGKAALTLYLMDDINDASWMIARADATKLPFKDNSFDVVICSEVLEHIPENRAAIAELVRVLREGKKLVVSVPRFLPERICWALSSAYHNEPGGHIRIYKKKELLSLLEDAGTTCWSVRYKHALHAPYWWLKCLVGHKNDTSRAVNLYKRFLEWDIIKRPAWVRTMDKMLNPLIAKSIVFYLKKG